MNKSNIMKNAINKINTKQIPIRKLYDESIKYAYGNNQPIEISEDKANRLMVNHIRHELTTYNKTLRSIHRINDKNETQYYLYKNAVLYNISKKYPMLNDECRNQMVPLNMVNIVKSRANK